MPGAEWRRQAGAMLRWLTVLLLGCGLLACGGGAESGAVEPLPDMRPVAAADPGSALPANWQQGAFMEIHVRAYQDSDGDGIGDLRGLISRLDYLHDLGVRGLWLMPVFASQDHDHGYAVADYRSIEPAYGTLADFDELLRQAHARGIGVIIDYVLNHSAAQHPLFQRARSDPASPYRDWYLWSSTPPQGWSVYGSDPWRGTGNGYYYAPFWDQMPDFNLRHPAVLAWHHDNLRFWLNRGVDGFRFDAVGNLIENGPQAWNSQPENHVLMRGVADLLRGYQNRYMVCEAPDQPQRFAASDSCGNAFAFGTQTDLVAAVLGDAAALERLANDWLSAPAGMAAFASNHDSFAGLRLWDQLGGDEARLKLAAATYLLQSRTPFIYYGEELGMAGSAGLTGDAALRGPMSWDAAPGHGFSTARPFRSAAANLASHNLAVEQGDPASPLQTYRQLLALRQRSTAFSNGRYTAALAGNRTLQFRRVDDARGETVWVGINYGAQAVQLQVDGLVAGALQTPLWPETASAVTADPAGRATLMLPARSLAVFRLIPAAMP